MSAEIPAQDVILACIHRYAPDQVMPFVKSLRRAGYTGRTVFFYSEMNPENVETLRAERIEMIPSGFRQWPGKRPLRKMWLGLRWLPERYRKGLLRVFGPLPFYRHFVYSAFLREELPRLRRVFLIDVRDVLFQAHPFPQAVTGGVHAFEEDRSRTIGTGGANRDWVLDYFGPQAVRKLYHEPVLCAGTILGAAAALREFIAFLIATLCQVRRIGARAGDQGVFNHAVRLRGCPPVTVHRNGASAVLTMGAMPEASVRTNHEGLVVDEQDRVIPVLHQVDRHPALYQALLRRLVA